MEKQAFEGKAPSSGICYISETPLVLSNGVLVLIPFRKSIDQLKLGLYPRR